MIGWLLKKVAAAQPAKTQDASPRTVSPEACAIWHDIDRALSQSARPEGRRIISTPKGAK
jgi:hypothetical protein